MCDPYYWPAYVCFSFEGELMRKADDGKDEFYAHFFNCDNETAWCNDVLRWRRVDDDDCDVGSNGDVGMNVPGHITR